MNVIQGKTECLPEETGYDSSRLEVLHRHLQKLMDKEVIFTMKYFLEPLMWTLMILEISKNGKELMLRIQLLLRIRVLPDNLCTFSHISLQHFF